MGRSFSTTARLAPCIARRSRGYGRLIETDEDLTMATDRQAALSALDAVRDPKSGRGLVEAGLVQGLVVAGGKAGFMLEVARAEAALYAPVRDEAEKALAALPGIASAQVVLTAAASSAPTRTVARPSQSRAARVAEDPQARLAPQAAAERPPHVRQVIAVASGKGGVGKSTVAVNLAVALARGGLSVGLLDADVYGPSAPTMLGVDAEPKFEGGKLQPLIGHGVKVMSIGFMIEKDRAAVWRGPMASSAVRQLAQDVAWGAADDPLDVLVCDLPPGTGDIQLTLVQKLKLDGVVVVSTPQVIALIDARRAVAMFRRTQAPILGLIENMAYFTNPATGEPIEIFGRGGAAREAQALGVPLLAEVPIDIALREGADAGRPAAPDSPAGAALGAAAIRVRGLLTL
jgi:ATP-binding protein involved in chromosome partitioning